VHVVKEISIPKNAAHALSMLQSESAPEKHGIMSEKAAWSQSQFVCEERHSQCILSEN
jgi:hypothetical protein